MSKQDREAARDEKASWKGVTVAYKQVVWKALMAKMRQRGGRIKQQEDVEQTSV